MLLLPIPKPILIEKRSVAPHRRPKLVVPADIAPIDGCLAWVRANHKNGGAGSCRLVGDSHRGLELCHVWTRRRRDLVETAIADGNETGRGNDVHDYDNSGQCRQGAVS